MENNRFELNRNLAQMLKGGVIMDVTTPKQAKIAEAAGACAVMALERIPADIRAAGGVSRMSDPKMIKGIQNAVSIPVMAKCRIGHFTEAQILQAIEIDPNDVIIDAVEESLLARGDIELTLADYRAIERDLRSRLEEKLDTAANGQAADALALKMVREVYEPVVKAVDRRYQVIVQFQ